MPHSLPAAVARCHRQTSALSKQKVAAERRSHKQQQAAWTPARRGRKSATRHRWATSWSCSGTCAPGLASKDKGATWTLQGRKTKTCQKRDRPRTVTLFPEDRVVEVEDEEVVRVKLSELQLRRLRQWATVGWPVCCMKKWNWTDFGPSACRPAARARAGIWCCKPSALTA